MSDSDSSKIISANSKDNRSRNWNLVLYPESLPANWRSALDELHIQWIESPLHDSDVNEGTGELKKAHYHVTLVFPNKKSYSQVKLISDALNGPIPMICHSVVGSVRYMAHMDNPDKFQYQVSDIVSHGGYDLDNALRPTSSQISDTIADILRYCDENGIYEFCDLVTYCLDNNRDWFNLVHSSHSLFFRAFFSSKRHKSFR